MDKDREIATILMGAWSEYIALYGDVPHGTFKQLHSMLALQSAGAKIAALFAVPEVDASQRTSKGGLTDPGADKEHSDVLKRLDFKISKYEDLRGSQPAGIEETLLRDARDAIRR